MKKLKAAFYQRADVLQISEELIGKILVTTWNGIVTSGRIVECEAYAGVMDKASHAYGDRRTKRTEIMYGKGGTAYVYFCYGIHHMFNVVTNAKHTPHAILIRALEPIKGIDEMLKRTAKEKLDNSLTRGPGNVCKALGIYTFHTGTSLLGKEIFIADDGFVYPEKTIATSPRIGVDYAGKDALRPYRFYVKGNAFVSGKPK
ncbi:MAG: DNA-3-methyladenine glycosylase [Chitinophagaceae bacterium]